MEPVANIIGLSTNKQRWAMEPLVPPSLPPYSKDIIQDITAAVSASPTAPTPPCATSPSAPRGARCLRDSHRQRPWLNLDTRHTAGCPVSLFTHKGRCCKVHHHRSTPTALQFGAIHSFFLVPTSVSICPSLCPNSCSLAAGLPPWGGN